MHLAGSTLQLAPTWQRPVEGLCPDGVQLIVQCLRVKGHPGCAITSSLTNEADEPAGGRQTASMRKGPTRARGEWMLCTRWGEKVSNATHGSVPFFSTRGMSLPLTTVIVTTPDWLLSGGSPERDNAIDCSQPLE